MADGLPESEASTATDKSTGAPSKRRRLRFVAVWATLLGTVTFVLAFQRLDGGARWALGLLGVAAGGALGWFNSYEDAREGRPTSAAGWLALVLAAAVFVVVWILKAQRILER